MGESHVVRYGNDETITVTAIDANHCPGAAMFVFEGQFGRILYTGDFRYTGSMLYDEGLYSLCSGNIDVLFLDNTFCDARCVIPSRENALVEILRIIRSYPDAQIKIGLRNLGKEELLVQIAHSVDEWIGVSAEKYRILQILCMPNVFMVSSSCRIQVVPLIEVTAAKMRDWNCECETVAILPTAIGVALFSSLLPQRKDIHIVPYSDHCSYEELQQFVSMVKPRKIVPILGPDVKDRVARSLPNRVDMSCFQVNVDDDQVLTEENNLPMTSKQQDSACLSHSTNMDKITLGCTQSNTRKKTRGKGGFSFKKKAQLGIAYMSSESPRKRSEQLVVTSADSVGTAIEQSEPSHLDSGTAVPVVICSDADDNVCSATADIAEEKDQHSEVCMPIQHNSVHSTSNDSNLNDERNAPSSSNSHAMSALNFDNLDNARLLCILEPLITKEAEKIKAERQSSFQK